MWLIEGGEKMADLCVAIVDVIISRIVRAVKEQKKAQSRNFAAFVTLISRSISVQCVVILK